MDLSKTFGSVNPSRNHNLHQNKTSGNLIPQSRNNVFLSKELSDNAPPPALDATLMEGKEQVTTFKLSNKDLINSK